MLSATNKNMLTTVARGLGHLLPEMVFVGGAIQELYIPEGVQVAEVRQTDDVDLIIEIAGRKEFAKLEQELRDLEFEHEKNLICRWIYREIIVDVMPTNENILGFANQWYKKGIPKAIAIQLEDGLSINILTLPYFIGCKLQALLARGMSDLRLSKDLEDIIFLMHYNPKLLEEVAGSDDDLKEFIKTSFTELRNNPQLPEAVFCVLPAGENDADNVKEIMFVINQFIHDDLPL